MSGREIELPPIRYFHVVMILPSELLPLTWFNSDPLYALLVHRASGTLQSSAESRWNGKLGITMVLHTIFQVLSFHDPPACFIEESKQ